MDHVYSSEKTPVPVYSSIVKEDFNYILHHIQEKMNNIYHRSIKEGKDPQTALQIAFKGGNESWEYHRKCDIKDRGFSGLKKDYILSLMPKKWKPV